MRSLFFSSKRDNILTKEINREREGLRFSSRVKCRFSQSAIVLTVRLRLPEKREYGPPIEVRYLHRSKVNFDFF